ADALAVVARPGHREHRLLVAEAAAAAPAGHAGAARRGVLGALQRAAQPELEPALVVAELGLDPRDLREGIVPHGRRLEHADGPAVRPARWRRVGHLRPEVGIDVPEPDAAQRGAEAVTRIDAGRHAVAGRADAEQRLVGQDVLTVEE